MKQYVLFEKDHVAMVKEYWDSIPEIGPGDKAYVADNGVQTVIVDRISDDCGRTIYECHTVGPFPEKYYLPKDKIFSIHEYNKCREAWEETESNFFKISPQSVGIEKFIAYDVALVRPWRGKRVGKVVYAVLSNGKVYIEPFGEYAYLESAEDPEAYIEELAKTFEIWAKERKGMCLKSDTVAFKDIYCHNGKYMSWDGVKYETA